MFDTEYMILKGYTKVHHTDVTFERCVKDELSGTFDSEQACKTAINEYGDAGKSYTIIEILRP